MRHSSSPLKPFCSFVPPLAALLLSATGGSAAQGVLIDKSEIRFVSRQMGVNVEGRFRKWRANVDLRPRDIPHSKAEFEIDLGSIDLASEDAEAEVRRRQWFDTAHYPTAKFESTAIRDVGADRYEIAGRLLMKGVARDVVVAVAMRKDAVGNSVAEGQFKLNRLDFNVGEGEWSDPSTVANEVVVRLRMVLPPA